MDSMQEDAIDMDSEASLVKEINLLSNAKDAYTIVTCLRNCLKLLSALEIENFDEEFLKPVMPKTTETLKQLYSDINFDAEKNLEVEVQQKLQLCVLMIETCDEILEFLAKKSPHEAQSFPLNLAQVLVLTFKHCENSQKVYHSNIKAINELVLLFKKSQDLHVKFMEYLKRDSAFFVDGEDSKLPNTECKKILFALLELILEMCKTLSGVNLKSMADSWKCLTSLVNNNLSILRDFNLAPTLKCLNNGISRQLKTALDLKKSIQSIKVATFLVKVSLKLFEICPDLVENYSENIVLFFCNIYSYPIGRFIHLGFPENLIETIHESLFLTVKTFLSELLLQKNFLPKICDLNTEVAASFGFVGFSNEILKILPEMQARNFQFHKFLNLMFVHTKKCYVEFFWDDNPSFYEDLIVNIAVAILVNSQEYRECEEILLKNALQPEGRIWTALIAIDSWILALENCSTEIAVETFTSLLGKNRDLENAGIFYKMLLRRLFMIIPAGIQGELISKYSPRNNLRVWKNLSLGLIPLSHRFHIEYVLADFYDKIGVLTEGNPTLGEVCEILEMFDVLAGVRFSEAQIAIHRLAPNLNRLWMCCSRGDVTNKFFKYFSWKLSLITMAIIEELAVGNLFTILNNVKSVLGGGHEGLKLLACSAFAALSQRRISNVKDRQIVGDLLAEIFPLLLLCDDKNPLGTQIVCDTFGRFYRDKNWAQMANQVLNHKATSSLKRSFLNYSSVAGRIDWRTHQTFLESIQESSPDLDFGTITQLPDIQGDDVDSVIKALEINTRKLAESRRKNFAGKSDFNQRQVADLKAIISKLELLLVDL